MTHITPALAFDRDIDHDGHMHVAVSHLTKANVCDYLGAEIPRWRELGLDPARVYKLLRDPDELQKAVPTFNRKPILDTHIGVSAGTPQLDHVIGTTGSDSHFNFPYVDNSLTIWVGDATELILTGEEEELSASYYYDADMTPGMFAGLRYDGIMRNIKCNHVALVKKGRAGPDVLVGDSALDLGVVLMQKKKFALMAGAALAALVTPRLAKDEKLDLTTLIKDVKSGADIKARLLANRPRLAADAKLDDVYDLLLAFDGAKDEDDEEEPTAEDDDNPLCRYLKGKVSEDELEEVRGMLKAPGLDSKRGKDKARDRAKDKARDEDDEPDDSKGRKDDEDDKERNEDKAMDAALKVEKRMRAIMKAARECAPFIGEIAMDEAPDANHVYKLALQARKVDLTGVNPASYGDMVRMLPKNAEPAPSPRGHLAMDADQSKAFASRFGEHTNRLRRS